MMCSLWLLGVLVYTTSVGSIRQMYGGKFVVGIGLGQMSVIAPAYVAVSGRRYMTPLTNKKCQTDLTIKECAHSQSRGMYLFP